MSTLYFNWHKTFTRYILSPIFILFTFCACGARTEQSMIPDAKIDTFVDTNVSIPDGSIEDSGCKSGSTMYYGHRVEYVVDCSVMREEALFCITNLALPADLGCMIRLSDNVVFTTPHLVPFSEAEWRLCTKEEFNRAWKTPPCKQDAGVGDTK